MIFHILSEISFPQAKLLKAKRNQAKEKALHNQLLTDSGLLEWELEEAKYKYQQMVPWKIDWDQIETANASFWIETGSESLNLRQNQPERLTGSILPQWVIQDL